jgi:glutamyl-tRNA(Gln) amidotransferase subunit D
MVYVYPGIKPELLKKLSDYDGIVLVGTGLGHVPTNPFGDAHAKSLLPVIKDLINSNIPVVMSSQALYGRLNMNVYTTGRLLADAGVIGDGCDWLPEVAYIKLAWVLGHTKDMKKIREEMLTNIVGELSDRSFI